MEFKQIDLLEEYNNKIKNSTLNEDEAKHFIDLLINLAPEMNLDNPDRDAWESDLSKESIEKIINIYQDSIKLITNIFQNKICPFMSQPVAVDEPGNPDWQGNTIPYEMHFVKCQGPQCGYYNKCQH